RPRAQESPRPGFHGGFEFHGFVHACDLAADRVRADHRGRQVDGEFVDGFVAWFEFADPGRVDGGGCSGAAAHGDGDDGVGDRFDSDVGYGELGGALDGEPEPCLPVVPPRAVFGEDPEFGDVEQAGCSAGVAFVDAALAFLGGVHGGACDGEFGGGLVLPGEVQGVNNAGASHWRFGDGEQAAAFAVLVDGHGDRVGDRAVAGVDVYPATADAD